jgi:hypothetical protein
MLFKKLCKVNKGNFERKEKSKPLIIAKRLCKKG